MLMLSLANQDAVRAVLFGDEGNRIAADGRLCGRHEHDPARIRARARRAAPCSGHKALDACVYGAPMHARSGELRDDGRG